MKEVRGNKVKIDLYAGEDPREVPTYSIAEAAHYLGIPLGTLSSWVKGRYYPTGRGKKLFAPIISLPDQKGSLLSFMNLVEAHILDAIRHEHQVPLRKIRSAINYLKS